jgi:hypothetical protein
MTKMKVKECIVDIGIKLHGLLVVSSKVFVAASAWIQLCVEITVPCHSKQYLWAIHPPRLDHINLVILLAMRAARNMVLHK